MKKIGERTNLIEGPEDFPNFAGVNDVYLDVETTAFNDKDEAFYPYNGNRMFSAAFTFDQSEQVYYLPIRHVTGNNVDISVARPYLNDMFRSCKRWVNHNPKFDAHFCGVDGVTGFEDKKLVDTAMLAKTIDSDRINHKLKPLCRDWLGMDMEEEIELQAYLKSIKSKNYARLPIELSARYAGEDVVGARALEKYCIERNEGYSDLWDTEIKLTSLLYRMEKRGLRADRELVRQQTGTVVRRILNLTQQLKDVTGIEYVDSNDTKYEILCDLLKLPILSWTTPDKDKPNAKRNPSFDKDAMILYAGHPEVLSDPKKMQVVKLLQEIGEEDTYNSSYLVPIWQFLGDDDRIHPNYNQNVRTGRMSCSNPNGMALSPRAKELFIPSEGLGFGCQDASQVEFRIIAHYCEMQEAIEAYQKDPKTDYHAWVAGMCEIKRKPAKNINFMMAFGGGKGKTVTMLSFDPDIILAINAELEGVPDDKRMGLYVKLATERAESVYNRYHARLPEIRRTSEVARALCRRRGWIKNAFGRRRHLPAHLDYRAFNSLVQSCAADLIKARMVAVEPYLLQHDVHLLMQVHDELLEEGPMEVLQDPAFQKGMNDILCDAPSVFKVPFVWESKVSNKNWKEAKP